MNFYTIVPSFAILRSWNIFYVLKPRTSIFSKPSKQTVFFVRAFHMYHVSQLYRWINRTPLYTMKLGFVSPSLLMESPILWQDQPAHTGGTEQTNKHGLQDLDTNLSRDDTRQSGKDRSADLTKYEDECYIDDQNINKCTALRILRLWGWLTDCRRADLRREDL